MLTSPKVMVPDQKERATAPASSSSKVSMSGTLTLLAAARQAGLQYVRQRRLLRPARRRGELDHLAGGLGLHEVLHALAVLVVVRGDVELVFHGPDELLRH